MEFCLSKKSLGGSVPDPDEDPTFEPGPETLAPDSFYVLEGSSAGTLIGTVEPLSGTATSATLVSETDPYNQPSSRTVLDGFEWRVAPGGMDFEASYRAENPGQYRGTTWYEAVIRFQMAGGGTTDRTYRIRAQNRDIRDIVKGDQTNNVQMVDTLDVDAPTGFRTRVISTAPNRTIKIDPNLPGAHAKNAHHTGMVMEGKHITVEGHDKAIVGKNVPIQTGSNSQDIVFKHLSHRVGVDWPGSDYGDRDSVQAWRGFDQIYTHNSLSWDIDEVIQVGSVNTPNQPRTKNILIYRSLIAEPLFAQLRPDEDPNNPIHPFGPLIGDFTSNVWIVESVIAGFLQRSPLFGQGFCQGMQNCLVLYGGAAGVGFVGDLAKPPTSVIVRNNLLRPGYQQSVRNRALTVYNTHGPNTEIYQAGNHFVGDHTHWDFNPDPVLTPQHVQTKGAATAHTVEMIFKDYLPFRPSSQLDAELMPTDTPPQIEAVFDHLIGPQSGVVGNRKRDANGEIIKGDAGFNAIDLRIAQNIRNITNYQGTGELPASGGLSRPRHPDDVGGYVV